MVVLQTKAIKPEANRINRKTRTVMNNATESVSIQKIVVDTYFMMRDSLDKETIALYKENLENIVASDPIVLFKTPKGLILVDGFHRFKAAKQLNWEFIPAKVHSGSVQDAYAYACTANLKHGKPLTPKEKKRAICEYIKLNIKLSNVQISLDVGISEFAIRKYRRELETNNEIEPQETRLGLDGREINVATIGTSRPIEVDEVDPSSGFQAPEPEKRQATVPVVQPEVECERCDVAVGKENIRLWHEHNLCDKCFKDAEQKPDAYTTYFNYMKKAKAIAVKPEIWRPAERWEQRKATMQPGVSEFELRFDVEAAKAGLPSGESHTPACIPDKTYRLENHVLHVFFDGPPNQGREDKDEELRNALRKQGATVLDITYERPTDETLQSAIEQVRTKLLKLGWMPTKERLESG
jgi:hypothetical protein